MAKATKTAAKKTTAAKTTKAAAKAVKEEIKEVAPVVETKVEAPVVEEKKAAPVAKTAETKKTTAAKTTKAAKTEAEVEVKAEVVVEFAGVQVSVDEVIENVKKTFAAESNEEIKSVKVYLKPEDHTAYYVINETIQGQMDVYFC